MSLSVYMALEMKRKDGTWEKVAPKVPNYTHESTISADFSYPNGCHDIFQLLGYEKDYGRDAVDGVKYGVPSNMSEEALQDAYDWSNEIPNPWSDEAFKPAASTAYINLADLHVEILRHPTVLSYEEDNLTEVENPLIDVYKKAIMWANLWTSESYDEYADSDLRIIGWIM